MALTVAWRSGCTAPETGSHGGVTHEHGQEKTIGEDDERDAETGGDGQFLDDWHLDQVDGQESHGIGQDGDGAGYEKVAEGSPGSHQLILAEQDFIAEGSQHLRGVAERDGENQKRHEN